MTDTSDTKQAIKESSAAIKEMNSELRELYQRCVEIAKKLESDKIVSLYQLGVEIDAAMDAATYGENAANKLAVALNVNPAELYRCRQVAQTWMLSEIQEFMTRKLGNSERRISWGHLWLIASIKDNSKLRESMLKATFKEGLVTRDLAAMIKQKLGVRGNNVSGRPTSLPKTPLAGLAVMHRVINGVMEMQDAFETSIFEALANSPGEHADAALLDQLDSAIEEQEQLREAAGAMHRKLLAAKDAVRRSMQTKSGPNTPPRITDQRKPVRKNVTASATEAEQPIKRKKKSKKPAAASQATAAAASDDSQQPAKKKKVKKAVSEQAAQSKPRKKKRKVVKSAVAAAKSAQKMQPATAS